MPFRVVDIFPLPKHPHKMTDLAAYVSGAVTSILGPATCKALGSHVGKMQSKNWKLGCTGVPALGCSWLLVLLTTLFEGGGSLLPAGLIICICSTVNVGYPDGCYFIFSFISMWRLRSHWIQFWKLHALQGWYQMAGKVWLQLQLAPNFIENENMDTHSS